jgi:hypothetical protein
MRSRSSSGQAFGPSAAPPRYARGILQFTNEAFALLGG